MEKSKTISQCAEEGGWCEKLVENVANYYKNIIKTTIPVIEIYLEWLIDEGCPLCRKQEEEIKQLMHVLKSESYGAK